MIQGVTIKELRVHKDIPDTPDDPGGGILMELVRDDEGILSQFGQTTFTKAHKGAIKAFHLHKKQDDIWFVATGKARVVMYDLRKDSKTYGETQVVFAGENDYKVIVIPIGVAHGYQVLSEEPVLLFYHTTESYNIESPDEERLPYNDPSINFNWNS